MDYKKYNVDIIYFDSYRNLKPPIELLRYFGDINIKYNHERYQKFHTFVYGHLCLKFLNNSFLGNPIIL